jgi:membrane protein
VLQIFASMASPGFLRTLGRTLVRDDVVDLAAQLAYYGILALFPFAIFLVTMLGFLPIRGLEDEVFRILRALMPREAARLFEGTIRGVVEARRGWLLAVSVGGSVLAASGGVSALITTLDRAYGVGETRSYVRLKISSILLVLVSAALIVLATAGLLLGPDFGHRVSAWFGLGGVFDSLWRWLRWPVIVLAMSSLLAFLYWACPNVDHPFRFFTPGSVVGVLLWIATSLAFGYYAGTLGDYNKTYGALAGGIVLLTWVYLSSLIVLVGGIVNAVLWRAGRPGPPRPA